MNTCGQRYVARLTILALVLPFALAACGGGGGGGTTLVTSQRGELVSSEHHGTISTSSLSNILTTAGVTLPLGVTPKYVVDFYALSYRTIAPDGTAVIASGLLLVPQKSGGSSPLLSVQHGTLTAQLQAPSSFVAVDSATYTADTVAGLVAASLGYVVAMPDYLGYGASSGMFHPYVRAASLVDASVDMLRASRSALQQLGVPTNSQLFLAGYSEGGYATLALQRELETSLAAEFPLTAAESGSGPYDLTGTTQAIMPLSDLAGIPGSTVSTDPAYLAFLIIAYDTYASSPKGLDYYFTLLALGCVNSYFSNGAYGETATGNFDTCVGSTLTTDILNYTFVTAFNNRDASVAALQQDIAQNDIYDWRPQVPTRLYYSPNDEVVPPANTLTASTAMVNNGSTSVEVVVCPQATPPFHALCGQSFYNDVALNFALYAQDL